MKQKINFILIVIFLLFANIAKAQDKDNLTLWFGVSWNPVSVSDLPLYLRDIPYYKGAGGVVDESGYSMSLCIPFDFRFLISNNNLGINYGIGAEATISTASLFIKNRYEYGGTSPFSGIILLGPISSTGLKPIMPGLSLNPNVFIEMPISRKDVKNNYNLHFSVGYQALTLVNGWDTRHNDGNQRLKYNKMEALAYLFPVNLGLQFNIGKINMEVGPSFLLSIKTKTGKDCDVNTNAMGLSFKIKMPED
jgi:hypothetical protein